MENYTQVKLVNGNIETIAYIPSEYAKLGKKLSLEQDGEWTNGWIVMAIYTEQTENYINLVEKTDRGFLNFLRKIW